MPRSCASSSLITISQAEIYRPKPPILTHLCQCLVVPQDYAQPESKHVGHPLSRMVCPHLRGRQPEDSVQRATKWQRTFEAIKAWKMKTLVVSIPVVLHLSVFLFLAGLWLRFANKNRVLGITVGVPVVHHRRYIHSIHAAPRVHGCFILRLCFRID